MYERHWQLTGRPFENWCDHRFYYASAPHEAALLKIRYAIEHRRSAIALCGDSGMGKTMLIDLLVDQLPEFCAPVARIVFPRLPADQLLGYVADELTGQEQGEGDSPLQSLRRIEHFLRENVAAGRQSLVIVDEAHLLSAEQPLEILRLLLNLRTEIQDAESAWTMVLVGDSPLLGLLERNPALDQRLSGKCLLGRLTREQTRAYVANRLQVVGGRIDSIFTPAAIQSLHVRGGGVPRRINRLADLALMVGYGDDLSIIDAPQIESVHQEMITVAA